MSILVNTHNELEENVLIAFLDSLRHDYKSDIHKEAESFLAEYNKEIDEAEPGSRSQLLFTPARTGIPGYLLPQYTRL